MTEPETVDDVSWAYRYPCCESCVAMVQDYETGEPHCDQDVALTLAAEGYPPQCHGIRATEAGLLALLGPGAAGLGENHLQ